MGPDLPNATANGSEMGYSVGAIVLTRDVPNQRLDRLLEPILDPERPAERHGMANEVAFLWRIDHGNSFSALHFCGLYSGMSDDRIGAARLDVPEAIPASAPAHPPR